MNSGQRRGKKVVAFIGLVLVLSIPTAFILLLDPLYESLQIGEPLPPLSLVGLDQDTVTLEAFKGRNLALLFFTTSCPHCKNQLMNFEALYRRYRSDIKFAAVSLSRNKETRDLIELQGVSFPVFFLRRPNDGHRIHGVPALFFADGNRILRYSRIGARSVEVDEAALKKTFLLP